MKGRQTMKRWEHRCHRNGLQLSPHHHEMHLSLWEGTSDPFITHVWNTESGGPANQPPRPRRTTQHHCVGLPDCRHCSEPPLDWPSASVLPRSVLLLLGSPQLSLSPLAHFRAHIPRSVFSAEAASVPYCWQCASIARSKMWGFSYLAASQGLRAGTVPCHSGPALKTLSGTDTRWRWLAWPHKALGRSSPFPGEWTPISIILVGSTLQGCVMVHISLSSRASFHYVDLRQWVLTTACSSIWLMENSLSGYILVPHPSLLEGWQLGHDAVHSPQSMVQSDSSSPDLRKLNSPLRGAETPHCEGTGASTNHEWLPIGGYLNWKSKVLWIFPIKD